MPLFSRSARTQGEIALSGDPALDDAELAGARDATARGHWLAAGDLLASTEGDWDRKAHRVAVLAEAAVTRTTWTDRWLTAEPDNPDALMVCGHAEILRDWLTCQEEWAAQGGDDEYWQSFHSARNAEDLCLEAASRSPGDPTPWVSLLMLARTQKEPAEEFWRRWQELRARDPYHREGHHQALQYLCARWHGSHRQMFEFAYHVADDAPYGSPLAALPLYAHAEYYAYVTEGDEGARAEHARHWRRPQILADIDNALECWLGSRPMPNARALVDLNYLAHALVEAGRPKDAAPHFGTIGPYATKFPWGHMNHDAGATFLAARSLACDPAQRRDGRLHRAEGSGSHSRDRSGGEFRDRSDGDRSDGDRSDGDRSDGPVRTAPRRRHRPR